MGGEGGGSRDEMDGLHHELRVQKVSGQSGPRVGRGKTNRSFLDLLAQDGSGGHFISTEHWDGRQFSSFFRFFGFF